MIRERNRLESGLYLVHDDATDKEYVLKPWQWANVQGAPENQQTRMLEEYIADNKTDGTVRSETDEQAMETAQNASTGEAHQEAERTE